MINGFSIPTDENYVWSQYHGATCHTSHSAIDLLRQTFDWRLIGRNGDVNWPPRITILCPVTLKKVLC